MISLRYKALKPPIILQSIKRTRFLFFSLVLVPPLTSPHEMIEVEGQAEPCPIASVQGLYSVDRYTDNQEH